MEAMLQRLNSEGLADISFIVINSRDAFAQLRIHELHKRVSFPVYQDSDEEDVWLSLGGGKDDVFIYDRCGNLTYYIPFPLSLILTERSIIEGAILSTYHDDPCGTCNDTLIPAFDDAFNAETSLADTNVTDSGIDSLIPNATVPAHTDHEQTEEGSGEPGELHLIHMEVVEATLDNLDISSLNLTIDFDPIKNYTTKETNAIDKSEIFETMKPSNQSEKGDTHDAKGALDNSSSSSSSEENESEEESVPSANDHNDHCKEFGGDACQDWSMENLNRAKRCCQTGVGEKAKNGGLGCLEFGRKRCKKILPLVKCCLHRDQVEKETISDRATDHKCGEAGEQHPCQDGDHSM